MNIRHAETKDGWGIANVRVNSWKTTYRGIYPDEKLDKLDPEDDKDKWSRIAEECLKSPFKQLLVAENEQGEIIGFAVGGESYDEKYDYDCEIGAIYLLEEYQGQGIGKQLVKEMVEFFLLALFYIPNKKVYTYF